MPLPPSPSKNASTKATGRIQLRKLFVQGVCIGLGVVVLVMLLLSYFTSSPLSTTIGPTLKTSTIQNTVDSNTKRKRLNAFVGVQSGFSRPRATDQYRYELRREVLRQTWFPSPRRKLDAFEKEKGIRVRFIIGHSDDATAEYNLQIEQKRHKDIVQLPLLEDYLTLPNKIVTFLRYVTMHFDALYVVKIDDDVYFRLDRLPHAIPQWHEKQSDYIGCMKNGEVFRKPGYRWREPQHPLFGNVYHTHVWGCAYVISGRVASFLSAIPPGRLRFLNNEDTTIGSWMLAFNVSYFDDRRFCTKMCTESSLVVYDIPTCAGLCSPHTQLLDLHKSAKCRATPGVVPLMDEILHVSLAKPRHLPPKIEREGVAI